jgi:hypothetical protein
MSVIGDLLLALLLLATLTRLRLAALLLLATLTRLRLAALLLLATLLLTRFLIWILIHSLSSHTLLPLLRHFDRSFSMARVNPRPMHSFQDSH